MIQNCSYPSLPKDTFSIYSLYHLDNRLNSLQHCVFWLGGRLTGDISADFFLLGSQYHEIKCFLSADCRLFFDFNEDAKSISWKEVFFLLREGDHLLIYVESAQRQMRKSAHNQQIQNIKKLTLVSINKKRGQMLSSPPELAQQQKNWFDFLNWVHIGMKHIGLERIETPTLVDCPGTEPDLSLFETRLFDNKKSVKLFLSSSPEMHIKRLLCRGWTDIYEIKKCFRNNESGPINHTEFYLLEWYRAYSDLNILIEDLQFLLNFLSNQMTGFRFPQLKKVSMKSLFKKHLNMELHPRSPKKVFVCELEKRNVPFSGSSHIEDLFYLLFLNGIEPHLDFETPFIVYDYPFFQKAYARIGPEGWASRFELFWRGMELANAFDEVIESKEQELRFQEDGLKRKKCGKQLIPPSYKLLNDMKAGMPPSTGVALGLDRLFLVLNNLDDIQQIRFFV